MISYRPKSSALYLERPCLLQRLPEEAGYVVWLEAPYGYGKSVLASQWAEGLERQGWRVLWLALDGEEVKTALVRLLNMAPETPWALLLESLWQRPTLLVLEDLEGDENLTPLLKRVSGLLLLASRSSLHDPELPRLMTGGWLIHLQADALAFTPQEATELFHHEEQAQQAWERTRGWSLPLHFAALTGEIPERRALLEGVREDLTAEVWEEMLLLATLSFLPIEAATQATETLVRTGFVQGLEEGYRLHALAAEAVLEHCLVEVRAAVARHRARLAPVLQGEAFARAAMHQELAELLESGDALARNYPDKVLSWDQLAPQPRGAMRRLQVGMALCLRRDVEKGIAMLLQAAEDEQASPDVRLMAYGQAAWFLTPIDRSRAEAMGGRAEPLVEQATPDIAGQFLNNAFRVHFHYGAWEQAEIYLDRALAYHPSGGPRKVLSWSNLAIVRWHRVGDLMGLLAARGRALSSSEGYNSMNLPGDHLQLGELKLLLGRQEEALEHFVAAQQWAHASPRWALQADATRAYVQRDVEAFANLVMQAVALEDALLEDRVRAWWVRTLTESGDLEQALQHSQQAKGFWTCLARALVWCARGQREQALAELPPKPDMSRQREDRLYWQAARYRMTRAHEDLEALLELTLVRDQVLPGLVPIGALPHDRPELSKAYPLADVLQADWKEAAVLRVAEVPPLLIKVFGRLRVDVLGQEIGLSSKLRSILALLLLHQGREAIGEALWPELSPEKMRNNLNAQWSLLRKALEPWGVPTYLTKERLVRTESDLWALEEALHRVDVEAALRLYRPPLMPGLDMPVIDELRSYMRSEVLGLLLKAAEETEQNRAEAYLKRVLELDPIHEEALQMLLRKLMARGRRREAETHYRLFAARLAEEMDQEPL